MINKVGVKRIKNYKRIGLVKIKNSIQRFLLTMTESVSKHLGQYHLQTIIPIPPDNFLNCSIYILP